MFLWCSLYSNVTGFLVDNLSGTLKTTESWLVKTGHFFARLACDFS